MKIDLKAYWRLMRFDKPIGIALLWFPVSWSLWLANQGHPAWPLVGIFLLGTVTMRAAGCVINDIADRHIDRHVERTANRPLTTGEVTLPQALSVFVFLLGIALFVVLHLPLTCFYWSWLALGVSILYPFCKRWIQAPQLMLSVAFSVAIPMVYIASSTAFNVLTWLLVMINILWVVAYDTMYAMVDRADDLRIGVKSTAILFGRWDCWIIFLLQSSLHGLWLLLGVMIQADMLFYVGWLIAALIIGYQQILIRHREPELCFKAFKISVWYGLTMWIAQSFALAK